jgi:hypothetical protein
MDSIPQKISRLITEHVDEVKPLQESYDSGPSEGEYWAEIEWPAGSENYYEVKFLLSLEFNPAEPQTYDYPGSDAYYDIHDVKVASVDDVSRWPPEFAKHAIDVFNKEHEDAAVNEILQKADDDDVAAYDDYWDSRMDRERLGESKNSRSKMLNEAGVHSVTVQVEDLYWPPETEGEYGVPVYTATIEADVSIGQSYPGDRINPPEGPEAEVRNARVVGMTRSDHDMEGNVISTEEIPNWPEGLEKSALNNFYKYNQESAKERAVEADTEPYDPY